MQSETVAPPIIQGGMGVGLSNWVLAKAVSQAGQIGVVSGTAIETVVVRRLQNGDLDGNVRRALKSFPNQEIAERILKRYFRADGRTSTDTYMLVAKPSLTPSQEAVDLVVAANFVEVWLAKEGHQGLVGINFLEKIQMATPAAVLGAMTAGVDYILMGAGIPREIPNLIKDFASGYPGFVHVEVAGSEPYKLIIDPIAVFGNQLPPLKTPKFLAIVSSDILAAYLAKEENTKPDGFVVEGHLAGGHNAPPRGKMNLDENNEPIYSLRDEPNLAKMLNLGIPFWLAGSYGNPNKLKEAQELGAAGIQVGTLFALCMESGLADPLRKQISEEIMNDHLKIVTDPAASPTGFPIKIAHIAGTMSDEAVSSQRSALCDLGYLRTPFLNPNGRIDYRCPGEPVDLYVKKGGAAEETHGRHCLCNGLTANIGLGQHRRSGFDEQPIVTLGSDISGAKYLLEKYPEGFSAVDAIDWLLGQDAVRRN